MYLPEYSAPPPPRSGAILVPDGAIFALLQYFKIPLYNPTAANEKLPDVTHAQRELIKNIYV